MRYWSRLDPVYEHVNGDSGRLCIAIRIPWGGENSPSVGDGLTIVTYKCTYPGEERKQAIIR